MMKRGRPRKPRPHTSKRNSPPKAIAALLSARVGFGSLCFFPYSSSKCLYGRLLAFRLQRSSAKCALFHKRKENRNENQDVNRGSYHSADDGCGDRLHDVGTDAGFP